jgi:PmbA protein
VLQLAAQRKRKEKPMTTSYEKLAQQAIDLAKKAGATDAICHVSRSESTEMKAEDGQKKTYEGPREHGISLTVFKGKKLASVDGIDLSVEGLTRLAERAVSMAEHTAENPYAGLSEASQWATPVDLDKVDSKPLMDVGALQALAEQMSARASAVKGVTKGTCYASTSYGESVTANSNGLLVSGEGTYTSLTASALVGAGDDTFIAYWGDAQRYAEDLEPWEFIVDEAVRRSLSMLGAAPIKNPREMPVFFDEKMSTVLLRQFMSGIGGDAVFNKSTFLKDALSTEIFNPNITITDDPLVVRGLGSRYCDSQGVAMQKRELVTQGVLNEWLLTIGSGKKLGLPSNGFASGTSNLTLSNGFMTRDDLLNVEEGFLVTGLMGTGANIMTGDYSCGAQGFLIKDGKVDRPIKGVTIAGHLSDMYKQLTQADDLKIRGATNAPTCYVGPMKVSAA